MIAKRYPIILIAVLLCSYAAPTLDSLTLSEDGGTSETSSRSAACSGDVCISEVLVNAFGSETGAVGPNDLSLIHI